MKLLKALLFVNLVFLSFPLLSAHGQEEDWTLFWTNLADDKFYYSPQSIIYGGEKIARVLQKVVSGQADSDIREVVTGIEFNCVKTIMYRRLKTETLSRSGERRLVSESLQWQPASLSTVAQTLGKEVCPKMQKQNR